eukprot:gene7776-15912_t
MQGTGKTYEVTGETTEWEDILIKKNILTRDEVLINKGLNPEDFIKETYQEDIEPPVKNVFEHATLDELDEMEDENSDERILEKYREKRIEEMKMQQLRNRFGEVFDISRDVWVREVTDSSKSCWVVVHLYQDSVIECRLMHQLLAEVASKYKYVKFLRIQSTQAVENWPDKNLPTLFLYHDGELQDQLITLRQLGGRTKRDLEKWLAGKGVIEYDFLADEDLDDNMIGNSFMKITNKGNVRRSTADSDSDEN